MKRKISDDDILAALRRRAGQRMEASSLAESFDVSHRTMIDCLDRLHRQGRIQRDGVGSRPAYNWYVPSDADNVVRAAGHGYRMREWTPDPEFLRRAKEAQEHREQFPSKHL